MDDNTCGRPWTCPACGAKHDVEPVECKSCGIIAAKVARRMEAESEAGTLGRPVDEASGGPRVATWVTVAASLVLMIIVAVVAAKWLTSGESKGAKPAAGAAFGAEVKRITEGNFKKEVVAASEKAPVLVEFYALH